MRFARLSLLLALSAQALAAKKPAPPPLPPLPPLVLPGAAPVIEAQIAGQPVRLTVDFGSDPLIMLGPAAFARLNLAADTRADGETVDRGRFRVAVGQVSVAVPYSEEQVNIAGRSASVRVLAQAAAPTEAVAGSDGVIGLALLPQDGVRLNFRPRQPSDRVVTVAAEPGARSSSMKFDWPLPKGPPIEVELHPLRPVSVASVAAASRLAEAGDGKLSGPPRRVLIGFGVARPVRSLVLARPLAVAGATVTTVDVRLFDWAGKAQLPPDAENDEAALVTGKRGRQRGWPILKLGRDVLGRCASISWQRDASDPQRGRFELTC